VRQLLVRHQVISAGISVGRLVAVWFAADWSPIVALARRLAAKMHKAGHNHWIGRRRRL
jgi:hypothetical protein